MMNRLEILKIKEEQEKLQKPVVKMMMRKKLVVKKDAKDEIKLKNIEKKIKMREFLKTIKSQPVVRPQLFVENKLTEDKKYHPYKTGCTLKEKKFTDLFNYVWIPREGRREGKVKYISECLNIDDYKNNAKSTKTETSKVVKTSENDVKNDKIFVALQKKKINDLKIVARDMKIKGYSTMKKDDLVAQIHKRGREYENSISIEYLNRLNERYEAWVSSYTKGKLVIIEVDTIDFVNNPEDLGMIINKIDAELNGLF
jgi:hypothetical protein